MKWIDTTVGEYCPFVYGKGLPQRNREKGNIPVYGSNGIVDYHNKSFVKNGGIIIGRKGSVGVLHLSKKEFWPIDTAFFIEKDSIEELYFTFYLLKSLGLEHMNSDSAVPGLNRDNAHALEIRIPASVQDRKLLGAWIAKFDEKLELNIQTNQTLEQIAQAIFKSWFVDFDPIKAKIETLAAGGSSDDAELAAMSVISAKTIDELNSLKLSKPEAFTKLAETAALFPAAMQDSELGAIPVGWENGTIEDLVRFSSERIDVSELNLNNYISTENMLENKRGITVAASLPSAKSVPGFNENEILISNIRPYFKKIWLAEFKGGRSQDVLGFAPLDPEETEFAYNLLYQDRFFEYMMTTSKGAKMPRGDKSAIKQFDFPLPQKNLRLIFSKQVSSFYLKIRNTNKESEYLHALRDALLPELLSGKLGEA